MYVRSMYLRYSGHCIPAQSQGTLEAWEDPILLQTPQVQDEKPRLTVSCISMTELASSP